MISKWRTVTKSSNDDDIPNDPNLMVAYDGAATATEVPEEDAAIARRKAIQAIMHDTSLSDGERRMRIQNLMSGGRTRGGSASRPRPSRAGVEHLRTLREELQYCSTMLQSCFRVSRLS
jgi:hypothetical protein